MENKCQYCFGKGKIQDVVEWSDGLGMVDYECPVCKGKGEITTRELMDRLVVAERGYSETDKELKHTQTHVALYLMQVSGELEKIPANHRPCDGPSTNLLLAPNPGKWGWKEYIKTIADKAPRIK